MVILLSIAGAHVLRVSWRFPGILIFVIFITPGVVYRSLAYCGVRSFILSSLTVKFLITFYILRSTVTPSLFLGSIFVSA